MKLTQLFLTEAPISIPTVNLRHGIINAIRSITKRTDKDAIASFNKEFGPQGISFHIIEPKNAVEQSFAEATRSLGADFNDHTGRIRIFVSPKVSDIVVNRDLQELFVDRTVTSLKHELVHREQAIRAFGAAKRRSQQIEPFRPMPAEPTPQQYLSDPHEIGAFANDVIEQLEQYGFDKDAIIHLMKQPLISKLGNYSARLNDAIHHLGRNDPAIKRLKKTIIQILMNRP